jgi:hypothetical protein
MALGAFGLWVLAMKVYRVEHKEKKTGPYGCRPLGRFSLFKEYDSLYYWWEDETHEPHRDSDNHPSPWCDGNLYELVGWKCNKLCDMIDYLNETSNCEKTYSWKCCFTSLPKLYEWFTKSEVKLLCQNDFKIATYEVPEEYVFNGEKQSIAIIGVRTW